MYKSKIFIMLALAAPVCAQEGDPFIQAAKDSIASDSLSSTGKAPEIQDQNQLAQKHAQEKDALSQNHMSELNAAKNPEEKEDLSKQHAVERASLDLNHAKEAHALHHQLKNMGVPR